MKITLCAMGSRGDIQPCLALAVGLQKAGHQATLVVSHTFAEWVCSYGVKAYPISFDLQEWMQRPEIQAQIKSGNLFRILRLSREIRTEAAVIYDAIILASQDADFVVIYNSIGGVEVANQYRIPVAFAFQIPFAPTREFPSFFLPWRFSLGSRYNFLTHLLLLCAMWPAVGGPLNHWRVTRLNLPRWRSFQAVWDYARSSFGIPWLNGYSPSVLPKPIDWNEDCHVTGYWFLETQPNWRPSEDLLRFLESGPPPVYVGFGSMSMEDPERQTRLVLRALELSGQRGVLSTGWGGLVCLEHSPNVFFIDDVPFSWLFPQMAVLVHHGGGTTSAGLFAGIPNIIAPFNFDQFAWADHIEKLGVGLRVPSIKRITAEKLTHAIRTVLNDKEMYVRAAALGEKIRNENGIALAVEVIERYASDFKQCMQN